MRLVAAFKNSKIDGVFYKSFYQLKLVDEDGNIEPFVDNDYYTIFDSVARKFNNDSRLECNVENVAGSPHIVVKVNLINLLDTGTFNESNLSDRDIDRNLLLKNVQDIILEHFIQNELLQRTIRYKKILHNLEVNKLKFDIS
ncbi:MAG: hypothetical protein PWQ25_252 [Deferribacteres bacterium]|jgi:hypothetical protein|nr:hypothetical protein [Deferribacteraceae bacterium]MDK2791389.1 hypothetical protein [Deferribacteres bacterium]